jgi:Mn2+/Fe2+ NRAMP family transporter
MMICNQCGGAVAMGKYPVEYLGPFVCNACEAKKVDDGRASVVLFAIVSALFPFMAIIQVLGGTSSPQAWGFSSVLALILVSIGAVVAPFNRWAALAFYGYGIYRLIEGYNPETQFFQKFESNFGILGIYVGSAIIYVARQLSIGQKQLESPTFDDYEYDDRKMKVYGALVFYVLVISLQVFGVFAGNKPPQDAGFSSFAMLVIAIVASVAGHFNRWIALAFIGYGVYRLAEVHVFHKQPELNPLIPIVMYSVFIMLYLFRRFGRKY